MTNCRTLRKPRARVYKHNGTWYVRRYDAFGQCYGSWWPSWREAFDYASQSVGLMRLSVEKALDMSSLRSAYSDNADQ